MLDSVRQAVDEGGIRRLARLSKGILKGWYYSLRYPLTVDAGKRVKVTGRLIVKGGGTVELGDFVSIRGDFGRPVGVNVASDATLAIGSNTFLNNGAYIEVSHGVNVGERCFIGPELSVFDRNGHHRSIVGREEGVDVGDDVWIGAQSTLLPGTNIGSGAIVGAGSVVNGTVEENMLVAGVPATPVRELPPPSERE